MVLIDGTSESHLLKKIFPQCKHACRSIGSVHVVISDLASCPLTEEHRRTYGTSHDNSYAFQ